MTKNIFETIARTALTGLAAFGFASASYATPSTAEIREGSFEAHVELARAIREAGVTIEINHEYCQENEGVNGFYSGQNRLLVVCNDNYTADNQDPRWTENDYDTFRHEAQHFIQDCMIGTNHDHHLNNVYKNPVAFARHILGQLALERITTGYRSRGASDHVIRLEYEAFAVAALNIPLEQAQDIQTYCMGG